VLFIPIDSKVHGDERHFIETIKYFSDFELKKVNDYKEVAPPLVFLLYAIWGKIFGFEVYNLRVFSLIIALITFLLLHYLFYNTIKKKNHVLPILFFFLLNPYIIGFNVFVFTDMLTLLFVILFCIAVFRDLKWLIFLSASSALLCRQYSIYILLAGICYYLMIYFHKREKAVLMNASLIAGSMIPLFILFIVWKGLAPQSGLDYWVTDRSYGFRINYLNTYIIMIIIYSFPLILFQSKSLFRSKQLLISAICSFFYFIFPVKPSPVTVEMTGHDTVGILHRFLKTVIPSYTIEHIVFYVFFVLGSGFLWKIFTDLYDQYIKKQFDFYFFLKIGIYSFLLVMPFSYQVWEKYLIVVLPLIFITLFERKENSIG
jgi:hypothetical protein